MVLKSKLIPPFVMASLQFNFFKAIHKFLFRVARPTQVLALLLFFSFFRADTCRLRNSRSGLGSFITNDERAGPGNEAIGVVTCACGTETAEHAIRSGTKCKHLATQSEEC